MVQIKNIHGEVILTLPEGEELAYANLIGLDLREADLRGADLSGACTIGTIFDNAILVNTILPIEYHHQAHGGIC